MRGVTLTSFGSLLALVAQLSACTGAVPLEPTVAVTPMRTAVATNTLQRFSLRAVAETQAQPGAITAAGQTPSGPSSAGQLSSRVQVSGVLELAWLPDGQRAVRVREANVALHLDGRGGEDQRTAAALGHWCRWTAKAVEPARADAPHRRAAELLQAVLVPLATTPNTRTPSRTADSATGLLREVTEDGITTRWFLRLGGAEVQIPVAWEPPPSPVGDLPAVHQSTHVGARIIRFGPRGLLLRASVDETISTRVQSRLIGTTRTRIALRALSPAPLPVITLAPAGAIGPNTASGDAEQPSRPLEPLLAAVPAKGLAAWQRELSAHLSDPSSQRAVCAALLQWPLEQARTAALALADHGDADATRCLSQQLQRALDDGSGDLAATLVRALGRLRHPTPETLQRLWTLARDDRSSPLAASARLMLGVSVRRLFQPLPREAQSWSQKMNHALARAAERGDTDEARQWLKALGNAGPATTVGQLSPWLASENRELRAAAAWALRFVPGSEALLSRAERDPSPVVRAAAGRAARYAVNRAPSTDAQ